MIIWEEETQKAHKSHGEDYQYIAYLEAETGNCLTQICLASKVHTLAKTYAKDQRGIKVRYYVSIDAKINKRGVGLSMGSRVGLNTSIHKRRLRIFVLLVSYITQKV